MPAVVLVCASGAHCVSVRQTLRNKRWPSGALWAFYRFINLHALLWHTFPSSSPQGREERVATPWAREHRGVPEGQVGWLEAIAPAGCCYCPCICGAPAGVECVALWLRQSLC